MTCAGQTYVFVIIQLVRCIAHPDLHRPLEREIGPEGATQIARLTNDDDPLLREIRTLRIADKGEPGVVVDGVVIIVMVPGYHPDPAEVHVLAQGLRIFGQRVLGLSLRSLAIISASSDDSVPGASAASGSRRTVSHRSRCRSAITITLLDACANSLSPPSTTVHQVDALLDSLSMRFRQASPLLICQFVQDVKSLPLNNLRCTTAHRSLHRQRCFPRTVTC